MKSTEELHLDSLHRVQTVCDNYSVELAAITEYAAERAALDDCVTRIEAARAINLANISAHASDKAEHKTIMINLIYKYMLRAAVKAHQLNNSELEVLLDYSLREITHLNDSDVLVKCEEIKEAIKSNLLILTNITAPQVVEMEAAISDYTAANDTPREAIDMRKALGTEAIRILISESDTPKNNISKLFHSYLPELAPLIDVASRIGKPMGIRYTSALLKYTDADTGVLLRNVKATATNGIETIIRYSTKLGLIHFYSLESDNWTITSEHETFEPNIQTNVGINESHIAKFEIKLQKKSLIPDDGTPLEEQKYGAVHGTVLNSVTLAPTGPGLIYINGIDEPVEIDEDSLIYKDQVKVGTYTGTVVIPGYINKPISITIIADEDILFDILMDPVSASNSLS